MIPAVAAEALSPFLRETLLFLTLAGVLIPLLQRLRVNQVLGFLAVGVAAGPFGLALWADRAPWLAWFTFSNVEGVAALAELGVIFLMFLIGLELSVPRVLALKRWVFGAGLAQVLLSAAAIGGIALAFGNRPGVALVLGLVLALSSTAVVMQLLSEQRALATPVGQASFSVLMLQDLAVVPLLILVDVVASKADHAVGATLAAVALKSVVAVSLIFVAGRWLLRPLFRSFARRRQPEVFVALTLLTTLSIGGATAAAGLSMALGAFLAGLLLGETEYRHEVGVTIEPFKGLLMGLFFMSVGMGVDLRQIAANPGWIVLSVAGLFLIKGLIASAVFRVAGLGWPQAVEAGLLLGEGGEFAFVVIGHALAAGLLAPPVAQFMMLVVTGSLFATPALARLGATLGARLKPVPEAAEGASDLGALQGHVIVAGCGRVGQLLAGVLQRQGVPFVAIEHDAHLVDRLRRQGLPVVYGNAARPDLLRRLHADQARAVVMTMDQPSAAMQAVHAARREYPALPVLARSRDEEHAAQLRQAGASEVVPETLEGALQLSGAVLAGLGVPAAEAAAALQDERERRLRQPPGAGAG
ncbi:MAG: cation:proton antiporter [Pseudomonadota bacterium]